MRANHKGLGLEDENLGVKNGASVNPSGQGTRATEHEREEAM